MRLLPPRGTQRRKNALKNFGALVALMVLPVVMRTGTWASASESESSLADNLPVAAIAPDDGREAFRKAYAVLMHPRCMNCHPQGDVPLQGEDSRLHPQNVKRGVDGKGLFALKCTNCHQPTNLPGENMPPGHPEWHLPPADMPMVFEGRSPAELARQLKDPKHNGGKTLDEILHHVTHDSLVLTGWNPAEGLSKPPMSHEEFVKLMREWIEKGAGIPE